MPSIIRFDRQQNLAGTIYNQAIQCVYSNWSSVTSWTTVNTYVSLNNGTVTIIPLASSSKFHIIASVQGYSSATTGVNIGISRTLSGVTTRLVGVDGSAGDAWAGSADGQGTNSYTINRFWQDSPGVSAGTSITYNVLAALWSGGTGYVNYSGYSGMSSIQIWELQP